MAERLEKIVDGTSVPSLGEELKQSVHEYPQTWKKYVKQLGPAVIISSIGAAAGQWAAHKLGYDSKAAMTATAYVCGYVPGFAYFFTSEYLTNKEKYPNGVLSKEFAHFAGTFMAADYVADLSTFTPAFISSNVWLADHTNLHPAVRSLVAWNTSALLYISAIAGLHPLARRATEKINKGIKKLGNILRKK